MAHGHHHLLSAKPMRRPLGRLAVQSPCRRLPAEKKVLPAADAEGALAADAFAAAVCGGRTKSQGSRSSTLDAFD